MELNNFPFRFLLSLHFDRFALEQWIRTHTLALFSLFLTVQHLALAFLVHHPNRDYWKIS